jgi:hypothetical protein
MRNNILAHASEFSQLHNIEYYRFEEDFVEANMRCIPMIVRFKMDLARIKLKLSQWSKFTPKERIELAVMTCEDDYEINAYAHHLQTLVLSRTGEIVSILPEENAAWKNRDLVPEAVQEHLYGTGFHLTTNHWHSLTNLQRFALIKLSREGHENKNLRKAALEFGIPPRVQSIQHTEYSLTYAGRKNSTR